jgi:hypothetical protein
MHSQTTIVTNNVPQSPLPTLPPLLIGLRLENVFIFRRRVCGQLPVSLSACLALYRYIYIVEGLVQTTESARPLAELYRPRNIG